MILFFILIFLFLAIASAKIKIEINNFYFDSQTQKHIAKTYEIKIKLQIFNKIPILKITINNKKIKKLLEKQKIKERIEKEKQKLYENRKNIDTNSIKKIRNLEIETNKLNLNVEVGTEDAALTALIIPFISTVITILLKLTAKELNQNKKFKVNPIYINANLINIKFSGIFQIKMRNIINMYYKKA